MTGSHFEVSPREREDEQRRWEQEFGVEEYAPADVLGNRLQVDPEDRYEERVVLSSYRCARCGLDLTPEDESYCSACGSMKAEAA